MKGRVVSFVVMASLLVATTHLQAQGISQDGAAWDSKRRRADTLSSETPSGNFN